LNRLPASGEHFRSLNSFKAFETLFVYHGASYVLDSLSDIT